MLPVNLGARGWKLAEILNASTALQGGVKESVERVGTSAAVLNHKTPLEMVTTSTRAQMLERLLVRLEYGHT